MGKYLRVKEKIEILTKHYNFLVSSIQNDPSLVLDSPFRAIHFKAKNKFDQLWKNDNSCIYPNCSKQAIQSSHSLQKSGPLKLICDNNFEVISPTHSYGLEILKPKPIPITKASTFPGFCKDHEKIFNSFENNKKMGNLLDIHLQSLRTICREIVRLKHELNCSVELIEGIIESRTHRMNLFLNSLNEYLLEGSITKKYATQFYEEIYPKSKKFQYNLNAKKRDLNLLLKENLKDLEESITKELNANIVQGTTLPYMIPVCISGLESHKIQNKRIATSITVIPEPGQTHIFFSSSIKNQYFLNQFTRNLDYFQYLEIIESAMMYSTDHWFLQPKIWNEFSDAKQKALTEMVSTADASSLIKLPFSIFDDVRRKMITESTTLFDTSNSPIAQRALKIEKDKLSYTF